MEISVLVPTYNAMPYLTAMVKSVLKQTFTDWEMVIVDDGSTDDTSWVLDEMVRQLPDRSIVLSRMVHSGCAAALKQAVELSTAPLCTFVGADDLLTPNSLRDIVRSFRKHPDVGFLWTKYLARSGSNPWKDGRSKPLPKGLTLKQALLSGWWGALAQDCFRRSAYELTPGLDPSLPFAVDQQLAMLFANLGCKVKHLPKVTYLHLQHNRQMSAQHYGEQQRCRGEILKRLGGTYVKER